MLDWSIYKSLQAPQTYVNFPLFPMLAQSVEHVAFNHVVGGLIPTDGILSSHIYN